MPLSSGTRIGPYAVIAGIGAGGMGEVYRARDTRLDRDVALKLLPPAVRGDPDRLRRFAREARDARGAQSSEHRARSTGSRSRRLARALVMEFVEGPTLAERIAAGATADRRRAADRGADRRRARGRARAGNRSSRPQTREHQGPRRRHREGAGLRPREERSAGGRGRERIETRRRSRRRRSTQLGVILGTAAYMCPEQASGLVADRRADIWAFGVVFFEMLDGRAAVRGRDGHRDSGRGDQGRSDHVPTRPPASAQLLSRCLERDPPHAAARYRRSAHRPGGSAHRRHGPRARLRSAKSFLPRAYDVGVRDGCSHYRGRGDRVRRTASDTARRRAAA